MSNASDNPVLVTLEDGICQLTLNRPDALNAITEEMHMGLRAGFERAENDDAVRVVLLTGAGRGFCAGQDLASRRRKKDDPPPDLRRSLGEFFNPLVKRIAALPKPVIAAVNGVAAGAGANLALACDIVFAAESAKFIQAFAKVGLGPDAGGSFVLPRKIGLAKAMGLALTGAALPAEQADRLGLIWKAVADDKLLEEARACARQLAGGPPLSLAAIKRLMRASSCNDLDTQLDLECESQYQLGLSDDYREGIEAFFEKRAAKFTGK